MKKAWNIKHLSFYQGFHAFSPKQVIPRLYGRSLTCSWECNLSNGYIVCGKNGKIEQ
jgi:hypothetical protein